MNRRNFLKGVCAGLVSLVLPSCNQGILQEDAKLTPRLDPTISLDQMVAFLRKHREKTIDYKTLWPDEYPIISFGENHRSIYDDLDIAKHLEIYRNQGATHLALEESPSFQPVINEYLYGDISDEDLLRKLKEKTPFPMEGKSEIIRKARELGIKVVCMDTEKHGRPGWHQFIERNKHMASFLASILAKEKNARIIAHAGAGHFSYVTHYRRIDGTEGSILPVSAYLPEKCIDTFGVMYAGGFKTSPEDVDFYKDLDKKREFYLKEPGRIIGIAAKLAGVDQEHFGVRLDETVKDNNWGHYIVHLPQKDK